jgi:hypothetical protein
MRARPGFGPNLSHKEVDNIRYQPHYGMRVFCETGPVLY